jgi:phosphate transport system substrate-binding protein
MRRVPRLALGMVLVYFSWACGGSRGGQSDRGITGDITVDGSSTVYPITEAVAEEFRAQNPNVRITIGVSRTGGGFKKFTRGEIDIADASHPINESELKAAAENKVRFVELPVAYDCIAVVVNPKNFWVDRMTVAELRRLWEPRAQGRIMRWYQIRPGWPYRRIHLFGPAVNSGTFEYFTEAVMGKAGVSRADFTSSTDDNFIVQRVSSDEDALAFLGYAYYRENLQRLKAVPIDDGRVEDGQGAVPPGPDTIKNGTYQPLSRAIFIYVNKEAISRPEVRAFVQFYLNSALDLVPQLGYVPLPEETYRLVAERFKKGTAGSVFAGQPEIGVPIERLLRKESGVTQ